MRSRLRHTSAVALLVVALVVLMPPVITGAP